MKNRELSVQADFKNAKLFGAIKTSFFVAPSISCLLVLLTAISAAVPVIEVYAVSWFIDTAIDVVNRGISMSQAVPAVAVIVILAAYKWLSGTLGELLWKKLSLRLSETFRVLLVTKCAKMKCFYFENKDAQECIARVRGLAEDSLTGIFRTACDAFTLAISAAGVVGIIMTKSILTATLILVVSIPMMFLARKSGDAVYKVSQENTKYERQYGYIGEVLRNREAVLERMLFGYTEALNQKWKGVYDQSSRYIQRAYRNWYIKIEFGSVLTALISLSGAAFLLVPVVQGKMSLGIYISLVNACFSLISAMSWRLRGIVESLAKHSGFMKDLNRVLSFGEEEGAVAPRQDSVPFRTIRFQDVSFRYPNSTEYVLKHVSFEMEAGKHYAMVGSNGAGKSTIIKILLGLYDSYEGKIFVDETDMRSLEAARKKSLFSAVYQDFAAYQISLRDNIRLGSNAPLSEQEIVKAVRELQLDDLAESLPKGLDNPLGRILEGGCDISGGQWQRVAIARCAVNPAPVRILDEPTAALDPLSESRIYENFSKISKDKTTIVISHRLGSTKLADEIWVLDQGKIVEKGSHQSLMEADGMYAEMFESQRSWYI